MFRGPLAVGAVEVSLAIYRAGEQRPDGTAVRRDAAWVTGIATYTLDRPARAGERVTLLDFAGAMREEPRGLDEVAQANYVDGPFDPHDILRLKGVETLACYITDEVQDVVNDRVHREERNESG